MDATAARSILLRLALVTAVLAGLLGMHTLITAPQHTAAVAAVTVEHHTAGPGATPTGPAGSDDCGPWSCEPLHAMGVMTCLLALLVASVLSGAAVPAGRWVRELPATALALVTTLRSVPPHPPSLVALSISRT